MAQYPATWAIPDDWEPEQDGYRLVLFCIPDSRQWRGLIAGHIKDLSYGRNWDGSTGTITEVQPIARDIFESLDMTCGDIARIADALEEMVAIQKGQSLTLAEMLSEMEETTIGDILDLTEVLTFLGGLLPGLPNIRLPITEILDARYKQGIMNLTEDMAISQRIQATAQYGTSGHALYDLAQNLIVVPSGFIGKAVWLWNRVKPQEIQGWFDWLGTLAGLVLGNHNWWLRQQTKIMEKCCEKELTVNIEQQPVDITVVSIGSENTPDGATYQFPDTTTYLDAKCNVSNAIYDTIHGFIDDIASSNIEELLSGSIGGVIPNLAVKLSGSGALGWAIGKVANALTSLAAKLLGSVAINFDDIASALSEQHTGLVCALYNATDTLSAKQDFLDTLALATTTLTSIETAVVTDLLTNDLLNQLFAPRSDLEDYVSGDPVDCTVCACGDWLDHGTLNAGIYASEQVGGTWRVTITFNWTGEEVGMSCGSDQDVTVTIETGTVTPAEEPCSVGGLCAWRLRSEPSANDDIYASNTEPSWPVCTRTLIVTSLTPFSISIEREDCTI